MFCYHLLLKSCPIYEKLTFTGRFKKKSFKDVDSWPKILLFRTNPLWNSTTQLILLSIKRLRWSTFITVTWFISSWEKIWQLFSLKMTTFFTNVHFERNQLSFCKYAQLVTTTVIFFSAWDKLRWTRLDQM